jgi:hypothetical protein
MDPAAVAAKAWKKRLALFANHSTHTNDDGYLIQMRQAVAAQGDSCGSYAGTSLFVIVDYCVL